MYTIDLSKVEEADVSPMSAFGLGGNTGIPDYTLYEFNKIGGGPENGMQYKFLHYLSSEVFEGEHLIDIGSRAGFSALALAISKKNRITSYDISTQYWRFWNFITTNLGYNNILFQVQDINKVNIKDIISCPFMSLDIDPHDGIQETFFFETLRKNNYQGLVMLDDTNWESMKNFISSITEKTCDITPFAHGSGTILVDFSNGKQFEIINYE